MIEVTDLSLKFRNSHKKIWSIRDLIRDLRDKNHEEKYINVLKKINERLSKKPMGYLKNSYENLHKYFSTTPWKKDITKFITETDIRDKRRGTDCRSVFPKLFKELDA